MKQNHAESELVHDDDKWFEYEKQIQWMIEYHIFSRHPHNDISTDENLVLIHNSKIERVYEIHSSTLTSTE